MNPSAQDTRVVKGQALIGLSLAALVIGGWIGLHVYGVYFHHWTAAGLIAAPFMVAVQTWLSVGLFIVAHDAMHGSLAPGRPRLNAAVGAAGLMLYAGFRFDRLKAAHLDHHRRPGSAEDPDFDERNRFWPWLMKFVRTYFGWREFAILTVWLLAALIVFRASALNLLAFWAAPAVLSAFQLFFFGTWLPHRRSEHPFADGHNARTSEFASVWSLLSCYHFGRHHQHHVYPWLPWWRLDEAYRRDRLAGSAPGALSRSAVAAGADSPVDGPHCIASPAARSPGAAA